MRLDRLSISKSPQNERRTAFTQGLDPPATLIGELLTGFTNKRLPSEIIIISFLKRLEPSCTYIVIRAKAKEESS